jgi:low affinity Fe/Cu permease
MPTRRSTNGHRAKARAKSAATGRNAAPANGHARPSWFTQFAQHTAQYAGRPITFLLAVGTIVVWGVSGPVFGFSDTWQLVINTGTTIVTFLMVFLIQHTQNRDALAFQLKLDELIIALEGAENKLAAAEDLCDEDLEALHEAYRKRASETHEALQKRRTG